MALIMEDPYSIVDFLLSEGKITCLGTKVYMGLMQRDLKRIVYFDNIVIIQNSLNTSETSGYLLTCFR